MTERLFSYPWAASAALALLFLALMLLPLVKPVMLRLRPGRSMSAQAPAEAPACLRCYRLTYCLTLSGSLLLLSACGTAPSLAAPCPPVPAELMTLPRPPVPLQADTRSTTPWTTTSPTPPPAAKTAPGTAR